MSFFTKNKFTSSSFGKGILVDTEWTLLCNFSLADSMDEVWLYAQNNGTGAVDVTFGLGNTGTSDLMTATIPPCKGLYEAVPGLSFGPGGLRARASVSGVISVFGWVNTTVI